ncbi:hypothetical protein [Bacillus coahuilensis]|uniref:hypothetical protein n=1 Tax=Bacillus coahuilensis TaxID=408580 RepID=UPI000185130D|nr:hypothetical protein [Bacillus coahuilensis]
MKSYNELSNMEKKFLVNAYGYSVLVIEDDLLGFAIYTCEEEDILHWCYRPTLEESYKRLCEEFIKYNGIDFTEDEEVKELFFSFDKGGR